MITKDQVKKTIRTYKGATLELRPITENDCGIVKNGSATLWARHTGLWSKTWFPVEGETPRLIASFRREVLKYRSLMAKAVAKAKSSGM